MKLIKYLKRKFGCIDSDSSTLNTEELDALFEKYGMKCIETEDGSSVYDSRDVTVFFNAKDFTLDVSFANSEMGYYKIKNASSEQVKNLVTLFHSANFVSTE